MKNSKNIKKQLEQLINRMYFAVLLLIQADLLSLKLKVKKIQNLYFIVLGFVYAAGHFSTGTVCVFVSYLCYVPH